MSRQFSLSLLLHGMDAAGQPGGRQAFYCLVAIFPDLRQPVQPAASRIHCRTDSGAGMRPVLTSLPLIESPGVL
jgi:hypothetical protein